MDTRLRADLKRGSYCFFVLFGLLTGQLIAQNNLSTDGKLHLVSANGSSISNGSAQDFMLPANIPNLDMLEFILEGGDGGTFHGDNNCNADGGDGSRVTMVFRVGNGANQLKPGGTIRFVVGKHGNSVSGQGGAGGGGGTAVLYLKPGVTSPPATPSTSLSDQNTHWILLGVAGGGGGAQGYFSDNPPSQGGDICHTDAGSGANTGTSGSSGGGSNDGGTGGNGGQTGNDTRDGGAGGGYLTAGDNDAATTKNGKMGGITGGNGGTGSNVVNGGFGYGGGGGGKLGGNGGGGGGGGYSGGGGGNNGSGYANNGGGAGSFVNGDDVGAYRILENLGNTGNPKDGYVKYAYRSSAGPIARCKDVTVTLVNGAYTLEGPEVDNGSSVEPNEDYVFGFRITVGGVQFPVSSLSFDCSDIGVQNRVFRLVSSSGAHDDCTFSLTVKDDVAPVVTCKDVFGGLVAPVGLFDDFQLSVADLEQSSSDACGEIISKTLSQSVFTCADIGAQTVTLTVTDNSGNTGQCAVNVGVVEANNIQYLFCPGDKNITLPAGECTVAVATGLVPLNISGPCSSSLSFQINRIVGGTEQAVDAGPGILSAYEFPSGDFVVRHLITSTGGETVSCSFNVTVAENDSPAALCRDVTVQLDENGDVSIVPGDIDDGSSDACGIQSAVLSQQSFSCADVGVNIVTLTVTDINGNAETCTSSVTIADDDNPCCTPPHAFCQDVTVQLDASGNGSLSANEVDDGSTADCGLQSLGIDITVFDCSDVDSPSAVTLTVTDVNGKASTCTATVTVEDKVPPTPFCRDVTVQLDANGEVSIVTGDIDNGSLDACGIRSVVLSQESFDCGNVGGLNIVALTVTDNSGNILSCFADVTVEDNVSPEALCQDVTVQLDASGTGSVTASDVDDGSSDACGIQSTVLSRQSFSCADVGVNIVTLTVTDINGNAETCTSSVTIADDDNPCCAPPQAFCQDVTVQLDASGNGSLSANEVDDGSTADCGLQSLGIDIIVFDCSDVDSPSAVTLTVTDVNGNASTCTATVKVEDNLPPVLVCQDVTIQLNSDGFKVFNTATLMDSQSDNCGGVLLSTGNLILNCANVGSFQATLTAEDSHENSTSCTQTVTVEDKVAPVAQCQDITVQLDEEGNAAIGPDDVDNGSSDACGVQSTVLSGQSFSCADVGSNTVTLTVTDVNNNTSTCTATVTVEDNIAPVLNCSDLTVSIENLHGVESVPVYQLYQGGADNCDGAFFPPFEFVEFGCGDVGTTQNLVFSYTDASGNTGACTSVVTIVDNTRPAVSCKNINVSLDENGQAQITANQVIFSAFDACGIQSRSVSQTDFDCDDIGPNVVQVTVTDNHGNSRSCNATVTVKDAIAPTAVCRDATVQLDPAGQAILTGDDLDNGSFDECGGIQSTVPSQQSFSCGNVGANTVTLTVTDVNNNASTCTATVTVEDNVAPDAVCRNVTVQLDENGAGSTTAAAVDNGSGDACGIQSAVLSRQSFGCADAGANTVTLTVTDVNNNTSTCSATVRVEDNISPIALCNNITVLLDMDGQGEITAAQVDNGSSDACGIQTLALNQTKFDCEQVGTVGVILVATDVNGNASTCSATVTVEDQVNPIALCRDATVQLDANGAGSTTAAAVDNGSADACGVHSTVLSQQSFSCGDVGANTVTLTVTDVNNNASTCTATVTVEDNVAPDAVCRNVTVQLDENGAGSTTAAAVDNGSGDACGIQSAVLSRQSFSCADMGANTVTLTVTDVNNNASTCSATVTVEDNLDPEVVCSDITVTFNGEGSIGLDPVGMATASDNCAVTGFEAGLPSIPCADLGEVVPVTVTAQDAGGNTASCTSHVTVEGLPCGWMSMPDGIGCTNGNEGSFDPDAETFTLLSSGCYTPSATSDESGYIKYQLCGNGTITAHIAGLTLPGYAGIVMRESDAPGAKKVAMAYQGGSAIARYVRYTDNGGAFPSYINAFGARWLRIVRTGNIFRGYYSVNGVTWTYAFAVTVPMDNCIQVGLIAWGTNANSAVTATFDHVVIDPPYSGGMQKGAPGNSVQPVSIAQETAAELWPNPTSGIAMLKLAGSGENEIEVLDDLGRQVIRKRVDAAAESVTELDLSGQAPGMYFVRVKGTDGEAALLRLVVADR